MSLISGSASVDDSRHHLGTFRESVILFNQDINALIGLLPSVENK